MHQKFLATLFLSCFFLFQAYCQTEEIVKLHTETGSLEGTLLLPATGKKIPVALIIAGSGPTDRNGNNPYMENNSLKMLSEKLATNGVATLRYDKRGIGNSKDAAHNESDLRFEHYVQDARQWVDLLSKDKRFGKVSIIGHSEGSLIGMIAAQDNKVSKFVSVAGSGEPAADKLRTQLQAQPPFVMEQSDPILVKLENGETVTEVPQILLALFRPSVQPYLISWFKYDPKIELAKLKQDVLIVQGTTDIQVSTEDAQMLSKSKSGSELYLAEGMNHILKAAEADKVKNIQTYSNPSLPLMPGLAEKIATFIKR